MIEIVGERGFADTTVGAVCAQAKVSRVTFYEAFEGLQECFLAVIDAGHERVRSLIVGAFQRQRDWQDAVRAALAALLALLDTEPRLARVWLVETLAAGSWALHRRERHIAALTSDIMECCPPPQGMQVTPLAGTAVIEAVQGIVRTRVVAQSEEPLIALLAPLMGLITAVCLDAQAWTAEIERSEMLVSKILAERHLPPVSAGGEALEIPAAVSDPRAHRARECLSYISLHPGASNRQVARAVGIRGPEQVSRLLARLRARGLLLKRSAPPGHPNAWALTPYGIQVLGRLASQQRKTSSMENLHVNEEWVVNDHTGDTSELGETMC
ncbi:MAG TPA: TetR family transcriptional regulator [Solirubrobacteraceae bacterium]|jgi:AcrR family transcriptional regulator